MVSGTFLRSFSVPRIRNTKSPKNSTVVYRKNTDPVPPPDDAIFLTMREAAYVLRVCYRTVYVWSRRQQNPPPVTWINNRSPRFPHDALIEWAKTRGK